MNATTPTRLIACRDCRLLHPLAGLASAGSGDAVDAALEACRDFLATHRAHQMAWFTRSHAEVSSDRPLWDPMATITFEVADDHRTYVATGRRTSIDEPRVYRFAPGSLDANGTAILIDDKDLRRGLDLEFYPHALRLAKVERFVTAVREVVSQLDPQQLPVAFDDADDPAVSIASMPDQTYEELLARCAEIFDAAELDTVSRFVRDNRREDGLLALRVRREFRALPA